MKETNIDAVIRNSYYLLNDKKSLKPAQLSHPSPKIGTVQDLKEAEEYWVQYFYLVDGYRINFHKITDCIKSCFMMHNELLNIWTHLLGAVFFIYVITWVSMYYNRCLEIYENLAKTLYESYVINIDPSKIQHDLYAYQQNLIKFSNKLDNKTKMLMLHLVSNIGELISSEKNFVEIVKNLSLKTPKFVHKNWLPKIANFHKIILEIVHDSEKLEQHSINFTANTFINSIADKMPKRQINESLQIWPILVYLSTVILC